MKKSQILAALALAFALGVVVPVSGTVSAFTAADPTATPAVTGVASKTEANNAVAYVKANSTEYANIADLKAAAAADKTYSYTAGIALDAEDIADSYVNLEAANAQALASNIKDKYTALAAAVPATMTVTNANIVNPTTVDEPAKLLVAAQKAGATPYLSEYRALKAAIEAVDNAAAPTAAEVAAVSRAASAINVKAGADIINRDDANLRAFIADPDTIEAYTEFDALITAVDLATNIYNSYTAGVAAYKSIATALNANNQLTAAGQAIVNAQFATANKFPNLVTLQGLDDAANIESYTAWTNVVNAVKNIEDAPTTTVNFYNLVMALAGAYRTAVPVLNTTNIELAQTMVGYKAPAGSTDTETPGDDQNADADAPNTGALLSSDKGATTVSIVAGLATALTALGAGVVAYRNARRSSK